MNERIKIVENGLSIDAEKLKKIVINKWQSGELFRFYYNQGHRGKYLYNFILDDVADYVDDIINEIEEQAQKNLIEPEKSLDWFDKYPKSDVRSIGFEVANKLSEGWANRPANLTTDDIPIILEFLDTPSDSKSILKAWNKWENYWANLDYAERRKKLLENCEE